MSHPPIPPRCKYVISNNGKHPMLGMNGSHTFTGELDKACIAAICRCGWLDALNIVKSKNHIDDNELVDILKEMSRCEDNAEAWRVWGEQE